MRRAGGQATCIGRTGPRDERREAVCQGAEGEGAREGPEQEALVSLGTMPVSIGGSGSGDWS